jgi:transposase InsO family protein
MALSQMFAWRDAFWNVKPDTLISWHRKGWPAVLAVEIQTGRTTALAQIPSAAHARDGHPERDLGRETYRERAQAQTRDSSMLTFVRNHPRVIVACDFFVVTVTFRILYVFVIMELGTRKIVHHNVTAHPTAEWNLQQLREALASGHAYRYVIHDRDSFFSQELDKQVTAMGVRVSGAPVRAPNANSFCERFGGTSRRECLDFLIPFNEHRLKSVLNHGSHTTTTRGRT